nr:RNA-directed DNA polymerase, eukaryota, reverse transcriptase zinc-binding domain protein [Tanacetum cinerariifolium]
MESIRFRFFNGADLDSNKAVWVKWNNVLASKDKGGLGVSSLYALNRALLFKWVWRFITQKNSLWARVISAIHGTDGKIGTRTKSGYNSLWRDIVFKMEAVKDKGADWFSFMQKRLGDGVDTCFWKDTWNGELPFKLTYPRIYALEFDKNLAKLEDQLEDVKLVNKRDRWAWSLNGSGEFSVASIRRLFDDIRLPDVSSQTRWIKAVPIKVNILTWKVRLNGLLSCVNISRRGIDIISILCPICERDVESISLKIRRKMSGYCGFQALGSIVNIKRCWKEFVMVFGGTYGFFETNGCLVRIVLLWRGCLIMSCCVLFIGFDIVVRFPLDG